MQFGAGPHLAEQCAPLPPPDGYRPWVTGIDGPMSAELRARAERFVAEEPIGTTLVSGGPSFAYPLVLIRSEPQIWRENADGSISRGCFQASAVYVPYTATERVTPPSTAFRGPTKLEITVGVLTVVSLTVGTLVTLSSWKKRRR